MIDQIARLASRVEFYVLLTLLGAAAIYFSIFEGLPTSAAPTVQRETTILPLLVIGIVILASGVVVFLVHRPKSGQLQTSPTAALPDPLPNSATKRDRNGGLISGEMAPIVISTGTTLNCDEAMIDLYRELSVTQQRVVTTVCEMTSSQLPIDDFFGSFVARHGTSHIQSIAEMYFRLEVLSLKGMCNLIKVGPGASVVARNNKLSTCLRERGLLKS